MTEEIKNSNLGTGDYIRIIQNYCDLHENEGNSISNCFERLDDENMAMYFYSGTVSVRILEIIFVVYVLKRDKVAMYYQQKIYLAKIRDDKEHLERLKKFLNTDFLTCAFNVSSFSELDLNTLLTKGFGLYLWFLFHLIN